jgi:precorrin-8X/cobalt-precorrin-8 methylmutase
MYDYIRQPEKIYEQSFATVRRETDFAGLTDDLSEILIRIVHSCGMPEIAADFKYSKDVVSSATTALKAGAPILCDCEMLTHGIIRSRLKADNPVICHLNDPHVPELAKKLQTTRSAAAIELWKEQLEGAVCVFGNAPTALFHLLEMLEKAGPRPAAILGFPVGFVGAAESKEALIASTLEIPYLAITGRRGGSAMAAAAVNALAGLKGAS